MSKLNIYPNDDPFELERLAKELHLREGSGQSSTLKFKEIQAELTNDFNSNDFPRLSPLSHNDVSLIASSFSVETFLLSRPYTSLPDLRTELREYLSELKEELVRLINSDYEAFISLSTDLRDEGERLERIKQPLTLLKGEMQNLAQQLRDVEFALKEKLRQRTLLREEKALLNLLLKISDSLNRLESLLHILSSPRDSRTFMETEANNLFAAISLTTSSVDKIGETNRALHLYHIAAEYNHLLYHISKARDEKCTFVDEMQQRIDRICEKLLLDLNDAFKSSLLVFCSDGAENSWEYQPDRNKIAVISDIKYHLRSYDMLGLWRDAEYILREEVVKKIIRKTLFYGALNVSHSPTLPKTPFFLTPQDGSPLESFANSNQAQSVSIFNAEILSVPKANLALLDETDNALAILFNRILKFVNNYIKEIVKAASHIGSTRPASLHLMTLANLKDAYANNDPQLKEETTEFTGFDIMTHVVWPEIGAAILEELGNVVFTAGKPDEIYKNYRTTQSFISSLENLAPSRLVVKRMRTHPISSALQKRWQLPVYYQLRRKEIAGVMEESFLENGSDISTNPSDHVNIDYGGLPTRQTVATLKAVRSCWTTGIYIPELSHKFWQLTLQILARYKGWVQAFVPDTDLDRSNTLPGQLKNFNESSTSRSSTPVFLQETKLPGGLRDEDSILHKFRIIAHDIRWLDSEISRAWKEDISVPLKILLNEDEMQDVEHTLRQSLSSLHAAVSPLTSHIVSILVRRCTDALTPVKLIPGQFRAMSNKSMPKTPSQFVPSILQPVKNFLSVNFSNLEREYLDRKFYLDICFTVFDAIADRYVAYLAAMRKTEESLRRLKKGKRSGFSLFGSGSGRDDEQHDEERVHTQLQLDVEAFGREAEAIGINIHSHTGYLSLHSMIYIDLPNEYDIQSI